MKFLYGEEERDEDAWLKKKEEDGAISRERISEEDKTEGAEEFEAGKEALCKTLSVSLSLL